MNSSASAILDTARVTQQLHQAIVDLEAQDRASGELPAWDLPILVSVKDDHPESLHSVIVDPHKWQIKHERDEPGTQTSIQNLSSFVSKLWQYQGAEKAMTYKDWSQVSDLLKSAMKGIVLEIPNNRELEARNPLDLPPIVAQERLKLLALTPHPDHLQAKLELTEIVIANLYGEPINTSLFSEQSLAESASWRHDLNTSDVGDYMEEGQEIEREIAYLKSELANTDESTAPNQASRLQFELAKLQIQSDECLRKIDTLEHRYRIAERPQTQPDPFGAEALSEILGTEPPYAETGQPAEPDLMHTLSRQAAVAYTLNDAEQILKARSDQQEARHETPASSASQQASQQSPLQTMVRELAAGTAIDELPQICAYLPNTISDEPPMVTLDRLPEAPEGYFEKNVTEWVATRQFNLSIHHLMDFAHCLEDAVQLADRAADRLGFKIARNNALGLAVDLLARQEMNRQPERFVTLSTAASETPNPDNLPDNLDDPLDDDPDHGCGYAPR